MSNHDQNEAIRLLHINKVTIRQEIEELVKSSKPLRDSLKAIDFLLMKKREEFRQLDRKLFHLTNGVTKLPPRTLSKHPIEPKTPTKSLDDLLGILKNMPKDQLRKALLED